MSPCPASISGPSCTTETRVTALACLPSARIGWPIKLPGNNDYADFYITPSIRMRTCRLNSDFDYVMVASAQWLFNLEYFFAVTTYYFIPIRFQMQTTRFINLATSDVALSCPIHRGCGCPSQHPG